jgi:hypothetical protein
MPKESSAVHGMMLGGEVEGQKESNKKDNNAKVRGHSPCIYLDEPFQGHVPDPVLRSREASAC